MTYPLSCTQEQWFTWEDAGAFGPRFVVSKGLRVTGKIDPGALQAALNDVVARHEILRSVIVRDADPLRQQVSPPSQVPLEIRELPGADRDTEAGELVTEADLSTMDISQLPLLRAVLGRFDEQDSVLTLVSHHTAVDAWSLQLLVRDLAECYTARVSGQAPNLPPARQYGDFATWQQSTVNDPAQQDYWRRQLRGARLFALPTDRPVRAALESVYSAYDFTISSEVVSAAGTLARQMRSTSFMVVLATVNALAYQITGTVDPVINTITDGRSQLDYRDTVGPFLNFLALRTATRDCVSFRDLLQSTRATCLQAYTHEVPFGHIERDFPDLMEPLQNPMNSDFVFGYFQSPVEPQRQQIADGAAEIRKQDNASAQLPGGCAWTIADLPSGELSGSVQFNVDEFDKATIVRWASLFGDLMTAAVEDPDRPWRLLHERLA